MAEDLVSLPVLPAKVDLPTELNAKLFADDSHWSEHAGLCDLPADVDISGYQPSLSVHAAGNACVYTKGHQSRLGGGAGLALLLDDGEGGSCQTSPRKEWATRGGGGRSNACDDADAITQAACRTLQGNPLDGTPRPCSWRPAVVPQYWQQLPWLFCGRACVAVAGERVSSADGTNGPWRCQTLPMEWQATMPRRCLGRGTLSLRRLVEEGAGLDGMVARAIATIEDTELLARGYGLTGRGAGELGTWRGSAVASAGARPPITRIDSTARRPAHLHFQGGAQGAPSARGASGIGPAGSATHSSGCDPAHGQGGPSEKGGPGEGVGGTRDNSGRSLTDCVGPRRSSLELRSAVRAALLASGRAMARLTCASTCSCANEGHEACTHEPCDWLMLKVVDKGGGEDGWVGAPTLRQLKRMQEEVVAMRAALFADLASEILLALSTPPDFHVSQDDTRVLPSAPWPLPTWPARLRAFVATAASMMRIRKHLGWGLSASHGNPLLKVVGESQISRQHPMGDLKEVTPTDWPGPPHNASKHLHAAKCYDNDAARPPLRHACRVLAVVGSGLTPTWAAARESLRRAMMMQTMTRTTQAVARPGRTPESLSRTLLRAGPQTQECKPILQAVASRLNIVETMPGVAHAVAVAGSHPQDIAPGMLQGSGGMAHPLAGLRFPRFEFPVPAAGISVVEQLALLRRALGHADAALFLLQQDVTCWASRSAREGEGKGGGKERGEWGDGGKQGSEANASDGQEDNAGICQEHDDIRADGVATASAAAASVVPDLPGGPIGASCCQGDPGANSDSAGSGTHTRSPAPCPPGSATEVDQGHDGQHFPACDHPVAAGAAAVGTCVVALAGACASSDAVDSDVKASLPNDAGSHQHGRPHASATCGFGVRWLPGMFSVPVMHAAQATTSAAVSRWSADAVTAADGECPGCEECLRPQMDRCRASLQETLGDLGRLWGEAQSTLDALLSGRGQAGPGDGEGGGGGHGLERPLGASVVPGGKQLGEGGGSCWRLRWR
eukprot:jgi/Mesvir1/11661/Mv00058-RA.1